MRAHFALHRRFECHAGGATAGRSSTRRSLPPGCGYLSGSGLMSATNMGRLTGIAAAKLVRK
jgi:hypothetical protein